MSMVLKKRKAPCSIGSCTGTGDKKTYNACKIARPEGVKVDRISLGPTFRNNQFYFNDTLYKRVWPWRLLQGDRPRFEKLHPGQLGNLVGLAPWGRMMTPFKPNKEEEERVPNGEEVAQVVMEQFQVPVSGGKSFLSPLLANMRLHFYLVHICDENLAKKNEELTPEEILKNVKNLDLPELKDYFNVISYHYEEISCESTNCLLKESKFYMCYKFDKNEQNVCLHTEVEGETTVSDTANFAFIIIVDYMPGFYKIKRLCATLPGEDNRRLTNQASYFLGSEFSFASRQTGLLVFISDGLIKIAYQYNASIENTFALAQVIAQELKGGGNDNAMDQDQ
ncbi:hypothetical protein C2G38_2044285 [Gigaspora rosea]|uniref:Uncharacterized protein n=1 Tax=Gigaspora rosea TaxID=44941 RepID=A0A397UQP3_9GLOM|nr:hypothetical protein C2G38_2044285 [Gigaspora rosea]